MDIKSWLREAKKRIDGLDAELIALRVFAPKTKVNSREPLGADRSWLVAHDVVKITTEMRQKADGMVRRRARGEPLAYILGEKEFYGRKFLVNEWVLIPRPETEELIELIKELPLPKRPEILEIGTGSGCVAITLALEFPQSYVLASDVSVKALETAEKNDLLHEGRVDLFQSNLLCELGEELRGEHFDVVVANLPYVSREWKWVKPENLRFEPRSALYARGENGLSFYRRMFKELRELQDKDVLWVDYVVVEADPCQHDELIALARKFALIFVKKRGYGLVFEDYWRYWWDREKHAYTIHKPAEVLATERRTGRVSHTQDE